MEKDDLKTKQAEFNLAISYYESKVFYQIINWIVSIGVVSLQLLTLLSVPWKEIGPVIGGLLFIFSYLIADFVNGFVHLLMDHSAYYKLPFGPFVANFHLHHQRPKYRRKFLLNVYFTESGSKVWLLFFMMVLFFFSSHLPAPLFFFLVSFSILSSVAEVSHYLCHTVDEKWVTALGEARILLSRKHHYSHHLKDNTNYCFLNGLADPLLNWIARRYFRGYKQLTDLHYAKYTSSQDRKIFNSESSR